MAQENVRANKIIKLQYLQSFPQLCFIGFEVIAGSCRSYLWFHNLDFHQNFKQRDPNMLSALN
jgi:hypothetical protein